MRSCCSIRLLCWWYIVKCFAATAKFFTLAVKKLASWLSSGFTVITLWTTPMLSHSSIFVVCCIKLKYEILLLHHLCHHLIQILINKIRTYTWTVTHSRWDKTYSRETESNLLSGLSFIQEFTGSNDGQCSPTDWIQINWNLKRKVFRSSWTQEGSVAHILTDHWYTSYTTNTNINFLIFSWRSCDHSK